MKVNFKKVILYLVLLIIWSGTFLVLDYTVGQHYGKNVAPQQFENDTTAYKELKTQRKVESLISLFGIAGGLLFLGLAAKQVKLREEKSES